METKTYNVYKFAELPQEIKDKVLEKQRDINVDGDFWHECIQDDAKEIGKLIGITVDNIYFSGFSSQGDGACFEGTYQFEKNAVKQLKGYAPTDGVLHGIAQQLTDLQRMNKNMLRAGVKHSGHYSHKYCTDIEVYRADDKDVDDETEKSLCKILRNFMQWIYDTLEKEYEYQTTDEAIIQTIEANDYNFNDDGDID